MDPKSDGERVGARAQPHDPARDEAWVAEEMRRRPRLRRRPMRGRTGL